MPKRRILDTSGLWPAPHDYGLALMCGLALVDRIRLKYPNVLLPRIADRRREQSVPDTLAAGP